MKFFDWLFGKKEDPTLKSKSREELVRELEPGLNALFGPEKGEYSPEIKPKNKFMKRKARGDV